jgi:hypothetical protein
MSIKKPESNYMVIKFNLNYDDSLVLPYKEGIQLMSALENTKVLKAPYGKETLIQDVVVDSIRCTSMGAQEYGEACLRQVLLAETASTG